jgi:hypothetical protein
LAKFIAISFDILSREIIQSTLPEKVGLFQENFIFSDVVIESMERLDLWEAQQFSLFIPIYG